MLAFPNWHNSESLDVEAGTFPANVASTPLSTCSDVTGINTLPPLMLTANFPRTETNQVRLCPTFRSAVAASMILFVKLDS